MIGEISAIYGLIKKVLYWLLKKHSQSYSRRVGKPMKELVKQNETFFQVLNVVVVPPPFFTRQGLANTIPPFFSRAGRWNQLLGEQTPSVFHPSSQVASQVSDLMYLKANSVCTVLRLDGRAIFRRHSTLSSTANFGTTTLVRMRYCDGAIGRYRRKLRSILLCWCHYRITSAPSFVRSIRSRRYFIFQLSSIRFPFKLPSYIHPYIHCVVKRFSSWLAKSRGWSFLLTVFYLDILLNKMNHFSDFLM